jgi:2-methylisocitrate lyase-like PEP mutase family enzyme/predicted thioesterase
VARDIPIGARGEASETVAFEHTLTSHHPELPPIYSTPDMIRLMETAAFHALQPYCEGDEISVGTSINIEHRAASGIGSRIRAEAVLESFDGRYLCYERDRRRHGLRHDERGSARDWPRDRRAGCSQHPQVQRKNEKRETLKASNRSMDLSVQKKKAEQFLGMHEGREILLLPNVWDVGSARMIEESGFGAVATTSAGIAFSLGYPDGQKISRDEMLDAVARIARAVKVPVTADVESGYGSSPENAKLTALAVIEAGAVGMNLEDAPGEYVSPLAELDAQVERIHAVREAAASRGVPLVLNARTDVYLLQVGEASSRYDETVRRLSAYRDAGADCVFAPGVGDAPTISRLVTDLRCPLNVLAGPGSLPVPELRALGVARVSLGSGPMRATMGALRRIAEEVKVSGTYDSLADAPSHAEMNRLLQPRD